MMQLKAFIRKSGVPVGVAAVLIAAIGAAMALERPGRPDPEIPVTGTAKKSTKAFVPTEAQWATIKVEPVQGASFAGTLETEGSIAFNDERTTPVFSPFSGRVTRLMAKLGDTVARGAPLMAVESTEFAQMRTDLAAAVAALDTARAQLALAQANEARQRELYNAQAGALKDWLQSQTDLQSAQNGQRAAGAALAGVRNRLRVLGRTDAEIDAMARGEAAAASGEAVLTAPIGGTVTQRQVGLGQYINSQAAGAATPVFAIGDLSSVWLVANVREADAPLVKVGQDIDVRVLALPERRFSGRIVWIAPGIDPATRRLAVRAEIRNADGALKPQMFATFSIVTAGARTAPGVPSRAVVYEGEHARVFVAANNAIEPRDVRLGRSRDGLVEVLSGLAEGEKIVTSGSLFIDRALDGQ